MRRKLRLETARAEDAELVLQLLDLLNANAVDYTNFFRRLSDFKIDNSEQSDALRDMFIEPAVFDAWAAHYRARLLFEQNNDAERKRTQPRHPGCPARSGRGAGAASRLRNVARLP